jgi:hypothetical protein
VIDADFFRIALVLIGCAGGDHDDRHALELAVGADVAGQVEAIHARHLDVGDDHVGPTVSSCSRASTPSFAVITR